MWGGWYVVYFVLADGDMEEVASDGEVTLRIYGSKYPHYDSAEEVFNVSTAVKKRDFQKIKVGIGAFERKRLIYSFGRINIEALVRTARVQFKRPDGVVLYGSDRTY